MISEQKTKFKNTEIGMINGDWELTSLGDICWVKNGKTNTQDATIDGEYPLFDRSLEVKRSRKFLFDTEAVIIPGEGKEFIPKYYKGKFDLHQRAYAICSIETKHINLKFVYYWICKNRDYLARIAVGSTVRSLRLNHLTNFPIALPDYVEQASIAKILSDLDTKIELNQQINKTLESIGQALFKRWFIDFEFPNEEGNPYKSSGGEMVLSEELDKEIPKGWEVAELGKLVTVKGRIGWKGLKKSEYLDKGFAIINGEQFVDNSIEWDNCGRITKERYDESPEIILKENDILMTKDGTIGKLAYIVHIPEPTTVASGVFVIRNFSENITQSHLYFFFKSKFFERVVDSRIEGSVVPHLYQRDIEKIKILIPSKEVLKKFDSVAAMTLRTLEKNRKENRILIKIRDSLLPKLMSGKIRVPFEVG